MSKFYDWLHDELMKIDDWNEREAFQRKAIRDHNYSLKEGDHCHKVCWSDIEPFTVVRRTKTKIVVRADKAEWKDWKPEWVAGGFSAICTNIHEQEWDIQEDPNGHIEEFRWSEKYGVFKNKAGERLHPEWKKYYDYNF